MKLIVGISGASGVGLGFKFLSLLPKTIHPYTIISDSAKIVAKKENLQGNFYSQEEIWAGISSGSFGADGMAIIPSSMNTLAKIANGIADELISRCASVMIKENKKLLIAPREMPLSPIALENMLKLSRLGVIIAPPIMGYYANSKDLDSMENFIIGRWMDFLGIENNLFERWKDN